jgi:hypothetical protein
VRRREPPQAAAEGLPIEGDRERGRYGDRPRFARDCDRDRDREDRGPRRERVPVAAEDIEVPEELNQ